MHKLYSCFLTTVILVFGYSTCFAQKDKDNGKLPAWDDKALYGGCWFVPHNSQVNIRFTEYSNFVMHDIDSNAREVTVAGKYVLDGHNLWLVYNDRPKQKFYFYKTDGTDEHFVIRAYPVETSELHFVHGNCD